MIDGKYIRVDGGDGSNQSAEIQISKLSFGGMQFLVSGLAMWGKLQRNGPNVGDFRYLLKLNDSNEFEHNEYEDLATTYSIKILVMSEELSVIENGWRGRYGMNVNFNGRYIKILA